MAWLPFHKNTSKEKQSNSTHKKEKKDLKSINKQINKENTIKITQTEKAWKKENVFEMTYRQS